MEIREDLYLANENLLYNLDADVTTTFGDEFGERFNSNVGVLTHINLQS